MIPGRYLAGTCEDSEERKKRHMAFWKTECPSGRQFVSQNVLRILKLCKCSSKFTKNLAAGFYEIGGHLRSANISPRNEQAVILHLCVQRPAKGFLVY
jgi:hypothetical protein